MSVERRSFRQFIITVGLALILMLLLVAPIVQAQGGIPKQFLEWAVIKKLTVQGGGATFQSDVTLSGSSTDLTVGGTVTGADLVATDDVTVGGNILTRALAIRLQDVANDASNNVLAATGVVSTTTSVTTSITNPDYPRNVVVSYQTTTTATATSLTIAGVDARGTSTSEALAVAAISGTQTLTGSVPWASITSFTWPTTRTEAVTLTVGLGEKFGLPLLPAASGDVFFVTLNNTYQNAVSYTVNITYGTVLPIADVAANDDFSIWVKQ